MIRKALKKLNALILVVCIIVLQFTIIAAADNQYPTFASLYSSTSGASIPVRTEPGIKSNPNSVVKGWLSSGDIVKVLGEARDPDKDLWYLIGYGVGYNETGYVLPKQIGSFLGYYTKDDVFEAKLTEQNFPESYKVKLRELHFLYPNWKFVAENINMNFVDAVAGERADPGLKLVHPDNDESWRSTDPNTYNAETKTWKTYDGGWYSASQEVVEYFMDPRNMLDHKTVFVFSPHNYNEKYDTDANLGKILAGTFMEGALQDDASKTYFDVIKSAGINSGVSPMAMAAKFIQEQGSDGTGGNVVGNISGFENLYNFFNVGAYADSKLGYNAVQRGLWWAAGAGSGNTSYGRPWNTREKSIRGGAQWYSENYVNVGQNSYYYMNFNIKGSNPFTHQYATNIEDAASKARLVSSGYTGIKDLEIFFYIPIYQNMPESTTLPTNGSNDSYLKSLEVKGYTGAFQFNQHTTQYELIVPYEQSSVEIVAVPNSEHASVSGAGTISLNVGHNEIRIVVTAPSGSTHTYQISVYRSTASDGSVPTPTISGSYKIGTYITGINPKTDINEFITNLGVKNGTAKVYSSSGAHKTTGYVGTGDMVYIYNNINVSVNKYVVLIVGDASGDGQITSRDLLIGQRSILRIEVLKDVYSAAMDIDKDGNLKSRDLLMGQRHILKLETIKQ